MTRKLPPLNALRAFEAAARHLSFTRAAEELFVTQAAISHQVKALEEHLGLKLFRRLNRRLPNNTRMRESPGSTTGTKKRKYSKGRRRWRSWTAWQPGRSRQADRCRNPSSMCRKVTSCDSAMGIAGPRCVTGSFNRASQI